MKISEFDNKLNNKRVIVANSVNDVRNNCSIGVIKSWLKFNEIKELDHSDVRFDLRTNDVPYTIKNSLDMEYNILKESDNWIVLELDYVR